MDSIKRCDNFFVKGRSFSTFVEKLDIIMVKSSEFHRMIRRTGKKRGWKWIKGKEMAVIVFMKIKMVSDTLYLSMALRK